jgi:hypothetical protein
VAVQKITSSMYECCWPDRTSGGPDSEVHSSVFEQVITPRERRFPLPWCAGHWKRPIIAIPAGLLTSLGLAAVADGRPGL